MTEWDRHTRYLELRLGQCTPRPELHRHQIPALQELLVLASTDRDGYMSRSGHLFTLTRAEWLDRYANLHDLYASLGDERQQSASDIVFRAGSDAESLEDFGQRIGPAMSAAGSLQLAATTCNDSIAHLAMILLDWSTEADSARRSVIAEVIRGVWRVIQRNDPGCSWDRVCSYPPYRNRLPFDAEALRSLGSWLEKAVGTQLVAIPTPEPPTASALPSVRPSTDTMLPSVAAAARGYHAAHEAACRDPRLRRMLPVYERIFEIEETAVSANDFIGRITEEDLVCALVRARYDELIEDGLRHCAGLCQPHLEHHYHALRTALAASRSTTELELEIARQDACLAIESSWTQVLLAYAFRPVTTALCHSLYPSEARRTTAENSYRTADSLFGNWKSLFDSEVVAGFFRRFFLAPPRLQNGPELEEIYRGEVGIELVSSFRQDALQHAIGFIAEHGLEDGEEVNAAIERRLRGLDFGSEEKARAHLDELLADAARSGVGRGVILWGQHLPFAGIAAALSSPTRPC